MNFGVTGKDEASHWVGDDIYNWIRILRHYCRKHGGGQQNIAKLPELDDQKFQNRHFQLVKDRPRSLIFWNWGLSLSIYSKNESRAFLEQLEVFSAIYA